MLQTFSYVAMKEEERRAPVFMCRHVDAQEFTSSSFAASQYHVRGFLEGSELVSLRSSATFPSPSLKGGAGQNGRASFFKNNVWHFALLCLNVTIVKDRPILAVCVSADSRRSLQENRLELANWPTRINRTTCGLTGRAHFIMRFVILNLSKFRTMGAVAHARGISSPARRLRDLFDAPSVCQQCCMSSCSAAKMFAGWILDLLVVGAEVVEGFAHLCRHNIWYSKNHPSSSSSDNVARAHWGRLHIGRHGCSTFVDQRLCWRTGEVLGGRECNLSSSQSTLFFAGQMKYCMWRQRRHQDSVSPHDPCGQAIHHPFPLFPKLDLFGQGDPERLTPLTVTSPKNTLEHGGRVRPGSLISILR